MLEVTDNKQSYRLLYKLIFEYILLPYCMILNYIYLNNNKKAEHFELLKIISFIFDLEKLKS